MPQICAALLLYLSCRLKSITHTRFFFKEYIADLKEKYKKYKRKNRFCTSAFSFFYFASVSLLFRFYFALFLLHFCGLLFLYKFLTFAVIYTCFFIQISNFHVYLRMFFIQISNFHAVKHLRIICPRGKHHKHHKYHK